MPQLNDGTSCTLNACPLSYATIQYVPTLEGNTIFLTIFSLLLIIQSIQAYRCRTWSYSIAMIMGLVMEVAGYIGRIMMHYDPFAGDPFLIYIICLTIGPLFFAAALYLILSRIIVHYSPSHTLSRFSPKTISITFITCDIIALILQAVGGALANEAETIPDRETGAHIMVAGLSFQVLSFLGFIAVASNFAWNVKRERKFVRTLEKGSGSGNGIVVPESETRLRVKVFVYVMALCTVLILTRSVFRVAQLSKGFTSKLANDEHSFMVLEGGLITLAAFLMTVVHPGWWLGGKWADAGWEFRMKKGAEVDVEIGHHDSLPLVLLK